MRCLIILAHPRRDSLCGALFDAVVQGAQDAGVEVRTCKLGEMVFEPDVLAPSPEHQALEPELARAQGDIGWAEHIVLVYPTWWGTFPARLKAFLDRTLTPGFAFRHRPDGHWDPLLRGRTAELMTTMDTPPWVYRWIYRAPGQSALASATLGYCGIQTVRHTVFAPVVHSTTAQRQQWLSAAHTRGAALGQGARSRQQRRRQQLGAWLAALRLQFYPMTWIVYTVGALAASGPLAWTPYWLGYAALFLLEAATVFINDWFDVDSDRRNTNSGPFSGGSRVLVDGRLTPQALRQGIGWTLGGAALSLAALGFSLASSGTVPSGAGLAATIGLLACLALGYTLPPLKLSHRGLGELDVVLTHSVGVLLTGYGVQGSALTDSLPWLLGLPLGVAILPSILLAGCPDREADAAAGKRTLLVALGQAGALRLAQAAAVLSVGIGWLLVLIRPDITPLLGWGMVGATLHAAWLWRTLRRLEKQPCTGRIDGPIVMALSHMLWFCLPPLIVLMNRAA